jgi:hypothetical protein
VESSRHVGGGGGTSHIFTLELSDEGGGGTSHISTLESSDEGGEVVRQLELPTSSCKRGGAMQLEGEANLP